MDVRELELQGREATALAEAEKKTADVLRQLAESASPNAATTAEMARRSGRQAEGARIEAEHALAAVQSLAKFGMELRQTPMQKATSRRFLDETLKFCDQLEKSQVNDPWARQQLASTPINAGEIHNALRNTEKATELLQRAVHLLEGELEHSPDDIALLNLVCYAHWM